MLSIRYLMTIIKPVKTACLMDVCAVFLKEIKQAKADGQPHYEIAARYTRSGNPITFNF